MPNEIVLILYFMMWYATVLLAILFSISGLDDLFFDCYYWIRYAWRFWKTRHYEPLTYEKLLAKQEQLIAVMLPCWREEDVIATMLKHNLYSIDYHNYYFFVGVYPNDLPTAKEVQEVANHNKKVQCVMGDAPGPTNKAANLNGIYKYIKSFEQEHGVSFSIMVLHDAEDIIHPLSFKLYNYLIPRKDMIQIPIFPLELDLFNFTHWLYGDEFAENHTKNIIVRESIGAHVPSAGVGTAFKREALEAIKDPKTHTLFSINSLTEDYRMSLALRVHDLKQIFVTQFITRTRWKKRFLGRGYVQKPVKEIIAVRALFPIEYMKAVRQKARWIIGIVFQEWRDGPWPKEWRVRYTLAHDRKSFITHFINGFGYLVFIFWLLYFIFTYTSPEYPTLQEQFTLHPWTWWLICISTVLMLERLLQRTIATFRIYGFKPACLVIPRLFYGNILNMHALMRAYRVYFSLFQHKKRGSPVVWDKTEHTFPGTHVLVPYRKRLGDLLLENELVSDDQLRQAIFEQQKTGERLGDILCRLNLISHAQLLQVLSTQYKLPLIPKEQIQDAQKQCAPLLPRGISRWLKKHGVSAVNVDLAKKILTIAILDPTNEDLLSKIIKYLPYYKVQFMLIGKDS